MPAKQEQVKDMRFLVVDNDPNSQQIAAIFLQASFPGLNLDQIDFANSVEDGLTKVNSSQKLTAAIIDIMLGSRNRNMTGETVGWGVRSVHYDANIIYTSSGPRPPKLDLRLGKDEFLDKTQFADQGAFVNTLRNLIRVIA